MRAGNRKSFKALGWSSVESDGGLVESMAPAAFARLKSFNTILEENPHNIPDAAIQRNVWRR